MNNKPSSTNVESSIFDNLGSLSLVGISLLGLLVLGLIAFLLYRANVKVAPPGYALVVSGRGSKDGALTPIVGGRTFVNPLTQRSVMMPLKSRQVSLDARGQSKDNIPLRVSAVATVKIGSDESSLRAATERFAGNDENIDAFTREQLEGELRGIIATLEVEELMRERKKFSQEIADNINEQMARQGLDIDSFNITGIDDDNGYIKSLSVPRAEEKRRAAEIASANADRLINQRRIQVDQENLDEEKVLATNKAAAQAEIGKANAAAEQAEELAKQVARQQVLEQESRNRETELDATVRKEADAERYRRETAAAAEKAEKEAQYQAEVSRAAAEAEVARQKAAADAEVARQKAAADTEVSLQKAEAAKAEAEAYKAKALAEANAIRAKGEAEAKAIMDKTEAMEKNSQIFLANEMISLLPEIMKSYADGYKNIGNITMVSDGSGDGVSGMMGRESVGALKGTMDLMKNMTGIDLAEVINSTVTGRAQGAGFAQAMKSNEDDQKSDHNNSEGRTI